MPALVKQGFPNNANLSSSVLVPSKAATISWCRGSMPDRFGKMPLITFQHWWYVSCPTLAAVNMTDLTPPAIRRVIPDPVSEADIRLFLTSEGSAAWPNCGDTYTRYTQQLLTTIMIPKNKSPKGRQLLEMFVCGILEGFLMVFGPLNLRFPWKVLADCVMMLGTWFVLSVLGPILAFHVRNSLFKLQGSHESPMESGMFVDVFQGTRKKTDQFQRFWRFWMFLRHTCLKQNHGILNSQLASGKGIQNTTFSHEMQTAQQGFLDFA